MTETETELKNNTITHKNNSLNRLDLSFMKHNCIVLNKYDNTRNGTLNVIPLTSRKEGKKYDSSSVNLGKELYNVFKDTVRRNVKVSSKSLDLIDKQIIKFFTK